MMHVMHAKHRVVIAALALAVTASWADAQEARDRLRRVTADSSRQTGESRVDEAAEPSTDVGKDFVPGTRVLFATDFARDEIGDFPRAFTLREGNAGTDDDAAIFMRALVGERPLVRDHATWAPAGIASGAVGHAPESAAAPR